MNICKKVEFKNYVIVLFIYNHDKLIQILGKYQVKMVEKHKKNVRQYFKTIATSSGALTTIFN